MVFLLRLLDHIIIIVLLLFIVSIVNIQTVLGCCEWKQQRNNSVVSDFIHLSMLLRMHDL